MRRTSSVLFGLLCLSIVGCAAETSVSNRPRDASTDMLGDGARPDMIPSEPGVFVAPTGELTTAETGTSATFTVVLQTAPSANVTIALSSSDATEGTVAPTSLAFTTINWNAPQTVTVTGVDDTEADGPINYDILLAPCVSSDNVYNGVDPHDVDVTNVDNETAGVSLSRLLGLLTTEAGGTDSFTVTLNNAPTSDVTIAFSSSSEAEVTVSPASILFTSANYASPQTITVTGVDDSVADGDRMFTVVTSATTSSDAHYNNLDVPDVEGTNRDDESAGINVDLMTALVTTEAGGTAMFSVVLQSQPMADVTIPVSSTDTGEGTVSSAPLTFTPTNWNVPQALVVTGVDDSIADGDQPLHIQVGPASSLDIEYSGLFGPEVMVTNTDDETAGFVVTPEMGLVTSESGGTATFTIVLRSEPFANVVFGLSSTDTTEGTVSPASMTFTTTNWNSPQTVTLTGANDAVADGDINYDIVVHVTSSTDEAYAGLADKRVHATNTDDETPGITVTPTTGLTTTEGGGTATFTVALNSEPTFDVTLSLSSDVPIEGTPAPTSLTFTAANWNVPQTVTVTGLDDAIADGNRVYHIVTAPAVSLDPTYDGRDGGDVTVTNADNDMVGVTLTPSTGLSTTEAGGTATFTVRLTSQPTANVTIGLSSSDTTEGSVSPASLSFTMTNWNMAQTVTVTGVDDLVADGAIVYSIVTAAASSTDTTYNGLNATDVAVSNVDNDVASVVVTPTTGLVTTEAGGTATFAVVLTSQPTANVVITVGSSNTAEGTVSPMALTFTSTNWSTPQTVTVTGANDSIVDGTVAYTIVTSMAASTDSGYSNYTVADVSVTNTDNDTAGILITPTAGLVTSEAGGTATFTIRLNSQPTASVTVGLTSSNTAEGTVSPSSVVLTAMNWSSPQTVTITGVNDAIADGNIAYSIVTAAATSTDTNYAGTNPTDVSVTNNDNDAPGVTVSPTAGLVTTEAGATALFTVVLASQPTANVTIALSTSDATEGTVSPASLTFTSVNWNTAQTVTVTGVNDFNADGNIAYTIVTGACVSTDAGYSGRVVADVGVTNTDNDVAGVTVSPTSGLVTTEAGGTAAFTLVLTAQPTSNVTIAIVSNDTTEGTVSTASIVFTSANWSTPQTVTVTGVNDFLVDGSIAYTVNTGACVSGDAAYNGRVVADVSLTTTDNDTAGITVSPSSGLVTTEAGGTATFTVVLTSQPTANVAMGLTSSDVAEGTVSPASVLFTSANWNTPQTVTVTGVNELVDDGNKGYFVVTAAATSSDANYAGINPTDVSVTNTDNDTAGATVTPTSGLQTREYMRAASFSVVLTSQPTASVTIGLSSSNTAEGVVNVANLTFTTANWNTVQTVIVTGVDDAVVDGNIAYSVITAACVSADTVYNGLNPSDISLTNLDNDRAGVVWKGTSALGVTEGATTATIAVILSQAPTANVTVPVSSSDTTEGTVSPSTLTFTAVNWNVPQTVTLTGVSDALSDGTQYYNVVFGILTSTDTAFSGSPAVNVPVVTCNGTGSVFAACLSQTNALQFATDDRVTVNDYANINFTGDFTVEAWVLFNTTQSQRFPTIVSKRSTSSNGYLFYICSYGCAGLPAPRFQMGGINYQFAERTFDLMNMYDGAWHHLTVTRTNGIMEFYYDAVLMSSFGSTYTASSVGGPLYMGREVVNTAQSNLDGRMHSVRIFNAGRTAAQIRTDMWTSPTGTVGSWSFNDGTGDTAAAGSGSAGFLGTASGADASDPTWVTPP